MMPDRRLGRLEQVADLLSVELRASDFACDCLSDRRLVSLFDSGSEPSVI